MRRRNHGLAAIFIVLGLSACGGGSGGGNTGSDNPVTYDGMTLVWADEFETDSLDLTSWSYDTGDGCPSLCGWGNNELEYYTDSEENLSLVDGKLVITAKPDRIMASEYSSAKITSKGKRSFQYGRIDVRAKLPTGQGLWPAIWLLPEDNVYGGWPTSGEIDIVELVGHEPNKVHGTAHYGPPVGYSQNSGSGYRLAQGDFSDGFHVFSVVWEEDVVHWLVDDVRYHSISRASLGSAVTYPFNEAFYLIINVAVGGNWPGPPGDETVFPQTLMVDYVRVYQ